MKSKGKKTGKGRFNWKRVFLGTLFFVFLSVWLLYGINCLIEGDILSENGEVGYVKAVKVEDEKLFLEDGREVTPGAESVILLNMYGKIGYSDYNDCIVMPISIYIVGMRVLSFFLLMLGTYLIMNVLFKKAGFWFSVIPFMIANVVVVASMDRGYLGKDLLIYVLVGVFVIGTLIRLIYKKVKGRRVKQ